MQKGKEAEMYRKVKKKEDKEAEMDRKVKKKRKREDWLFPLRLFSARVFLYAAVSSEDADCNA